MHVKFMFAKDMAFPARSIRFQKVCCLLTTAALLAGCAPSEKVARKSKVDQVTAVKTVAVAQMDVPRMTVQPATIHGYFRSEIHSRATGYVAELSADIGDIVEAGAELATIEVPELEQRRRILQARTRQLEAAERQAESGVELAAAEVNSAKANLEVAKADLSRVDAALAAAESEFNRTADLVARGSLQDRMLDEARQRRDSQRAARDAVQSTIASSEAKVRVAEAQAAAAQADLEAAKAATEVARREVEEIAVSIDFATLRAPISGIVSDRNIEPGNLVGRSDEHGGRPLFVIHQIDKVRVRIPVPEVDAPLVSRGDRVTLSFPSFSDETPVVASVARRSGTLDPNTRTMMVEVDLENPDGKYLPGMFGQATIELGAKAAANVLPARAVRFAEDGTSYVYVVDENDSVKIADVKTGIDDGERIEIVAGLQPNQQVIDAHLKRFREGDSVKVLQTSNR
jgi:RND family efflux transporter MFP subunit